MKTSLPMSSALLSAVAALMMTAGVAQAATAQDRLMNGRSVNGVPVTGMAADKVVTVSDGGSVRVDCGQIVQFQDGDKTFSWKFESVQHRSVALADIAPQAFGGKTFMIYVDRNEGEKN